MNEAITIIEDKLKKYGVTCSHPTEGGFLWIELPKDISAESVLNEAKSSENVSFLKGDL